LILDHGLIHFLDEFRGIRFKLRNTPRAAKPDFPPLVTVNDRFSHRAQRLTGDRAGGQRVGIPGGFLVDLGRDRGRLRGMMGLIMRRLGGQGQGKQSQIRARDARETQQQVFDSVFQHLGVPPSETIGGCFQRGALREGDWSSPLIQSYGKKEANSSAIGFPNRKWLAFNTLEISGFLLAVRFGAWGMMQNQQGVWQSHRPKTVLVEYFKETNRRELRVFVSDGPG